jgi:anti-sigma factor RsiW
MTCKDFVDFIRAYRDGELTGESRRVFEDHISKCASCKTYLREYGEIVALAKDAYADLDDEVPAEVPPELINAVLATLRQQKN